MSDKIAEIVDKLWGSPPISVGEMEAQLLALMEQDKAGLVKALKLARPYVEKAAKRADLTNVRKPANDLAKIDTALIIEGLNKMRR